MRDSFKMTGTSGVVIAGFGENDLFPRLKEFTVEGVIENKLRFRARRDVRIGPSPNVAASIIPFPAVSEFVTSKRGINTLQG